MLTLRRMDLRSTGSCVRQEQNRELLGRHNSELSSELHCNTTCTRRLQTTTRIGESVKRNISLIPSRVVVTVTACQSVSNLETDVLK